MHEKYKGGYHNTGCSVPIELWNELQDFNRTHQHDPIRFVDCIRRGIRWSLLTRNPEWKFADLEGGVKLRIAGFLDTVREQADTIALLEEKLHKRQGRTKSAKGETMITSREVV